MSQCRGAVSRSESPLRDFRASRDGAGAVPRGTLVPQDFRAGMDRTGAVPGRNRRWLCPF